MPSLFKCHLFLKLELCRPELLKFYSSDDELEEDRLGGGRMRRHGVARKFTPSPSLRVTPSFAPICPSGETVAR